MTTIKELKGLDYPIGSKWKTRGGWYAIVVSFTIDGFWCWHGNPNTTHPHYQTGKGHNVLGQYDLIERIDNIPDLIRVIELAEEALLAVNDKSYFVPAIVQEALSEIRKLKGE